MGAHLLCSGDIPPVPFFFPRAIFFKNLRCDVASAEMTAGHSLGHLRVPEGQGLALALDPTSRGIGADMASRESFGNGGGGQGTSPSDRAIAAYEERFFQLSLIHISEPTRPY